MAYIVCIGFLQCGIPHRTCRFYCCLAAHQRTKEMDSAEPLSSILWTPPPHPGESAAAGHFGCRGLYQFRYLVSGAAVYPQFRMLCSFLCSGLDHSRFSRVVGRVSHVFHYWWGRSFVPAATVGLAMAFRRICANRGWVVHFC